MTIQKKMGFNERIIIQTYYVLGMTNRVWNAVPICPYWWKYKEGHTR